MSCPWVHRRHASILSVAGQSIISGRVARVRSTARARAALVRLLFDDGQGNNLRSSKSSWIRRDPSMECRETNCGPGRTSYDGGLLACAPCDRLVEDKRYDTNPQGEQHQGNREQ